MPNESKSPVAVEATDFVTGLKGYETAYKSESFGEVCYGLRIEVSSDAGVTEALRKACYRAARDLEQAIERDLYALDPERLKRARQEKLELLSLFPAPIYVEEIPNGYCHQACCEHLPWFVVTTSIGRIKIGRRKSVIGIDWSESLAPKAEELFAAETSTKGEKMIHAWGYDKAREYIARLTSVSAQPTASLRAISNG